MKKLLLTAIIMTMCVVHLLAQNNYTIIKENMPKKAEFLTLEGKYGQDFIYIHDAEAPEHGNSTDAILCVDKQGNLVREISVAHPKMNIIGFFEGENDLNAIYRKQVKRTDSILIASIDKAQDHYNWAPKGVMGGSSKEVDRVDFSVSPDGKKFLVCQSLNKGKNWKVDIMVFNEDGSVDYEKHVESPYQEKHSSKIIWTYVANDGSAYFYYVTFKSDLSNNDRYTYLHRITRNEVLADKLDKPFPYQGVVTNRGDLMILKTSKTQSWVMGYNVAKQEFFHDDTSIPENFIDNSWMTSVCSIKGNIGMADAFTFPLGDVSGTLTCDWRKSDKDQIAKLKTNTYKDKDGKTKTTTTTEYETILIVDFSGNITSVTYNMEEEKFIHDTLFKRQRMSGKHGYIMGHFEKMAYRAFRQGNQVRVYYIDNNENYKDDGTEGSFGRCTFRQENPCWATATLKSDGMFSPRKRAIKNESEDFVLKSVLLGYDNYWIITTEGDKKKESHIAIFKY